ncbi:serine hydrolase domain-containing protein [Amycolatopsis sp. YIM 10]|uniref:serine hydrolase domain-containing protein n=1 Tax=Amycolatopsis sp. YIM 10 TaxID=2653857 RepID=UPI0012907ED5|nr:serine hydrolase domain-containing protein [Amycolatopsis sp. YIM 10]QFU92196.1 D-alanyl-D-alanine carboxypeptidase precursor [Amycolatopsis sp. YIM 10]
MIEGTVAPGFEDVREAFELDHGGGAQLAVHQHGEPVVDLWTTGAGDRISVTMSGTKALVAICAHLLAERGDLDLGAPVTHYWPEFGTAMPVAFLLSHRAGLPAFDLDGEDLLDWDRCVAALAALTPAWAPGTAFAYHSTTYGFLVGEVIRRVTGTTVGRFFDEELARPLGLDLWIGLPAARENRVSPIGPNRTALAELLTTRAGRAAEIPSANGIGDARSLAKLYSSVLNGLLKPATLDRACTPQTDGLPTPAVMPHPQRFSLGFELPRSASPLLGPASFGHAGAGGRLGFADRETGLAVGYVCTHSGWNPGRGPDERWLPWLAALSRRRGG